MLKLEILRYSRKTGKDLEPGEPQYQGTVYGSGIRSQGNCIR